jgi:hypothetical protein
MVNQRGGGEKELKKYLKKESRFRYHLGQFIIMKSAKVNWFLWKDRNKFGMYKELASFLSRYGRHECMNTHHSGDDCSYRWYDNETDDITRFVKENKKLPPDDDLKEMYRLYNNGKKGEGPTKEDKKEEVVKEDKKEEVKETVQQEVKETVQQDVAKETVQVKAAKKRCPNGTRKNKAGDCVKNKETETKKTKRCPKGSRKNKAGDCVKKTDI